MMQAREQEDSNLYCCTLTQMFYFLKEEEENKHQGPDQVHLHSLFLPLSNHNATAMSALHTSLLPGRSWQPGRCCWPQWQWQIYFAFATARQPQTQLWQRMASARASYRNGFAAER